MIIGVFLFFTRKSVYKHNKKNIYCKINTNVWPSLLYNIIYFSHCHQVVRGNLYPVINASKSSDIGIIPTC